MTIVVNDTLNFIDDKNIDRAFSFAADSNGRYYHEFFAYTWDGVTLTLLDSLGEPQNLVFTYRASDNVFLRDISNAEDDIVAMFQFMGITEMAYKKIK